MVRICDQQNARERARDHAQPVEQGFGGHRADNVIRLGVSRLLRGAALR